MKERLQKIISGAGIASRRSAEEMIRDCRISVNGIVASLGDSADIELDDICVDGKPICRQSKKTYIMLNKPRGYVTTLSDEKGRKCVTDLVADINQRVYPVGRLDMYSEGLLILTDDGEFANKLMHPSHIVSKTYHAWIKGKCSEQSLNIMRSRLEIDGYFITPAEVEVLSKNEEYTVLSITIHEGRNRQIRKMCAAASLTLTKLKRVAEGNLQLGNLQVGKWRYLTDDEVKELLNR